MKKIIILFLLVLTLYLVYNTNNQPITIPDSAIRLRVIPNSNSAYDLEIKAKVKDYLSKNIYPSPLWRGIIGYFTTFFPSTI